MFIPREPGKYFCQPFWNGKNQPRQLIDCYLKEYLYEEEIEIEEDVFKPILYLEEILVCDYEGYTHVVCLTAGLNRWEEMRYKKYILFQSDWYYPAGGLGDIQDSYDTIEEATEFAKYNHADDSEIVDRDTWETVWEE